MKVRPLWDWILVESGDDTDTAEDGLIIMPKGSMVDIHKRGKVVAVGKGRVTRKGVRVPVGVSPGEEVIYVRFLEKTETGKSLKHTLGEGLFLIQEKDIVGVIER